MEEDRQRLKDLVGESDLAFKQIDNVATHLSIICSDEPERITLEFLLAKMKQIRAIIKEYYESEPANRLISSPPSPAIFRMNADSGERSGAGAGPGALNK